MSQTKNQIKRVMRLQSIEENRLSALAVDLAVAQSRVAQLREVARSVQLQIETLALPDDAHTVNSHLNSMNWLSHLQTRLQLLAADTVEAEKACEAVMQQMIQQKVKVNGWEKLTEKMKSDFDAETMAAESLEADDRYLNNPATR